MIQEKWRREVESRQAQGFSREEAMRLAPQVSREVLTCSRSTKGDQLPLLEFCSPTLGQVQKAPGSKKLTEWDKMILERAALPVQKTLTAMAHFRFYRLEGSRTGWTCKGGRPSCHARDSRGV